MELTCHSDNPNLVNICAQSKAILRSLTQYYSSYLTTSASISSTSTFTKPAQPHHDPFPPFFKENKNENLFYKNRNENVNEYSYFPAFFEDFEIIDDDEIENEKEGKHGDEVKKLHDDNNYLNLGSNWREKRLILFKPLPNILRNKLK